MTTRLLICGATGQVGRAVGSFLNEHKVPWRGLSRNQLTPTSPYNTWVKGDLHHPESLSSGLKDIEVVFLASADGEEQARMEISMIDACRSANVRHIVKLSAQSAGLTPAVSFGRLHKESEDYLKRSGIGWTILRPTFFMQSIGHFANDLQKGRLIAPMRNGKVSMVDAQDVARCAFFALMEPDKHKGRTYTITGPRAVSFKEVAQEVAQLRGDSVRYFSSPLWLARLMLPTLGGMSKWQARQAADLLQVLAKGAQSSVTNSVKLMTGREATDLRTHLMRNAEIFKSKT